VLCCAGLCCSAGILAGEQAYQKKAKVGPTPGLTRQVAGFQVSAEPCVYVLDSAGVMVPAVPSDEVGLRLALAGVYVLLVWLHVLQRDS
jgi:ribosome biogenesis GTPase A